MTQGFISFLVFIELEFYHYVTTLKLFGNMYCWEKYIIAS
jgi:hypothetical protein